MAPPASPPFRSRVRLLRGLLRTPESVLDEVARTVGPVCGLGAGPMRIVVLGDPATIRELLMQPSDRFRWDHPISPFPFVVGETTMLASDGADHKRRRGAVQEAFSRRRLERWTPMIVEQTDAAIDRLLSAPPGAVVDLYPWGKRLVIEIVVRALFGERLTGRTGEIEARFQRIQDYLSAPLWRQAPHPLPFGKRHGVRQDREALDAILDEEIAAARSATPDEHDPHDILAALVGRGELSDAEIRDQVKTLIGAGYDTTSSTLAWLLWEATLQPDGWTRLREEADTVLTTPAEVSLPALGLAGRAVRETLRLHPGSGIAPRITAVDMQVGGVHIRAGTIAAWSPYLAGRDPRVWEHPLRFDPDRFLSLDDDQRAAADLGWVPFGRGPRSCIGFALAQMELTVIVARMAQRLDLIPTATVVPPAEGLVVSKPVGGVPMLVGAR